MNQPILEGALPILSSVLGNNTVAGLLAIFNLALNTVTTTTAILTKQQEQQSGSFKHDYGGNQAYFGQGAGNDQDKRQFQSQALSLIAAFFSTINSTFASLTSSETPLTTYIFIALLSYISFRIIYGVVTSIVRSILNLVKVSIMITIVTTILWFVVNVTSPPDDSSDGTFKSGQHRHQDPISKVVYSFQNKFKAEYERQQQHLQNPHLH
ncbi:hypothetical protein BGZ76_010569 [Entomortierella beljakovae]|nr:hypothetical protein BGZ76_010569 [Entomortierella beljakovae]